MILIQEIRSIWTKASRGVAAAASRNSVPEAAPFPLTKTDTAAQKIFRQRLLYGEANNFAAPLKSETVEQESGPISIGCVRVDVSAERVSVIYEYDYRRGGLPPRQSRPGVNLREEIAVQPEHWVTVKYNGRFSGDEWWYEKRVLNVGVFQKPRADIFISTRPAHKLSQMAELR